MGDILKSILSLEGWCPENKIDRLYNLVKTMKPALIVEFGVFGGRSFIPMALGLKDNDYTNDNKINVSSSIIGVDPWSNAASTDNYDPEDANYKWWNSINHETIFNGFLKALKDYDVEKYSKYIRKCSRELKDEFENETIDILHQDGNHSEVISSEEVLLFSNKIKHGGYWIMDDTDWATTRNAQELILQSGFELFEDHVAWKIFKKV